MNKKIKVLLQYDVPLGWVSPSYKVRSIKGQIYIFKRDGSIVHVGDRLTEAEADGINSAYQVTTV
jgi:hypothetical protein